MKTKRSRVTLQDVAKHAGVSRSTASLIVRGSSTIAVNTRRKVLASIRELGYVYDRVAANMRSQSSSTVGVIITDIANPFFSEFLVGVHRTLEETGYIEFLGTTFDLDTKQDRILSTMLEHRVGGIILCPVSNSSAETIERLKKLDVPIVHAVRELPKLQCDYVGIDYTAGAQISVNHLIQKGHRRISFIGGSSGSSAWKERMQGYENGLKKSGIEIDESIIIESPVTREGGMVAVHHILSQQNPPTAIFCYNDLVALGVMQGLRDAKVTPGEDIAVVGFDNVQESSLYTPSLTTVNVFARLIGSQAANLIHQRMLDQDRDIQRIILQPELVTRRSSENYIREKIL
ncbi:LacI family DNA-binding transcriptional regulator [Alkalihalobacillus sp. MEB130]|uniref:LacI family DNA-binding transcriptional regulator n=1 Tax=Alkalihalobacillus sp. MEB130 TaxID=2976704 RepID=UPI0028DED409|nr:LacI family DNA-binding transcriptional regulator [Alkalihalobacillus sp. MEB130]MDT8861476.1 LacI family DNA-binding transcriptional regulator [Alkalihalobacillus sp. MEB130]